MFGEKIISNIAEVLQENINEIKDIVIIITKFQVR